MVVTKKKLEVLFKAFFQEDKSTDTEIKKLLENKIEGLKIKSIETYPGKGTTKAVVNSNVVDILTGVKEPNAENFMHDKSKSFLGNIHGMHDSIQPVDLEMKEKEIEELKADISKLRNEDEKKFKEITEIFQQQIIEISHEIERLDNEKATVEKQNQGL